MMFSVAFLIFSAGVLSATAEDPASTTCTEPPAVDGWNFLKEHHQYDMLQRNFNTTGGEHTKCLTSNIKKKDETKHLASALIQFQLHQGGPWYKLNQEYQFSRDRTEKFNIMRTTRTSEGPKASYRFGLTLDTCAVVYVDEIDSFTQESQGSSQCLEILE
uniref:Putative salivary lipocalin n=1 Tax=Rhipicephalus pulchellus TaxID=72859 RepID=L7LQR5_RHIPC